MGIGMGIVQLFIKSHLSQQLFSLNEPIWTNQPINSVVLAANPCISTGNKNCGFLKWFSHKAQPHWTVEGSFLSIKAQMRFMRWSAGSESTVMVQNPWLHGETRDIEHYWIWWNGVIWYADMPYSLTMSCWRKTKSCCLGQPFSFLHPSWYVGYDYQLGL